MSKNSRLETRSKVFGKFNGKCGYTGTILKDNWTIDHIESRHELRLKSSNEKMDELERWSFMSKGNSIDNMIPTHPCINTLKGKLGLEGFRELMNNLHLMIDKGKPHIIESCIYFDIDKKNPFIGKFYFETL